MKHVCTLSEPLGGIASDTRTQGAFLLRILMLSSVVLLHSTAASGTEEISGVGAERAVVAHYANLLEAEFDDAATLARRMQSAITNFLAAPSDPTLQAARQSWVEARPPFLQAEASRFYDGPIDAVEAFINSWPIDENCIDYTASDREAGIINHPDRFPTIDRASLLAANEREGEKSISSGFHVIEFLLWGQDQDESGPGARPWTDYALPGPGQPQHVERRRDYIRVAAALLVEQLEGLARDWAQNEPGNDRTKWLAHPESTTLANILKGIGILSSAELGGERLLVPYTTKEQEEEHSCFSDTTHLDLLNNQIGIRNVLLGRYVRSSSIRDLVAKADPELASALTTQMEKCVAALSKIPPPFDQAIRGRDTDPGRMAIKKAIDALRLQSLLIARAAKAIGLNLNL